MAAISFTGSHAAHRAVDATMLRSVALYIFMGAIAITISVPLAIATIG